uniref:CKLF-like MARVEL transmembrane domain-containing protein 4-like protein n=1 Tax=Centropages tenuiremis TaxID=544689 RepID=A0A0U2MAE5_9MAXI|nr:CKLF-like MARVEL transmembrane domain-containing protein 4-like protein [Centropages tenuiremis]
MMSETNGVKPHTTVTVSTDPTVSQSLEIRLNIGYFRTWPGIIKLIQLSIGIICMALSSPAKAVGLAREPKYGLGHNHWFLFVVVTCFIITLIWTFYYLLQIREFIKIKLPFTFLWVELVYTTVATAFYVIAFIVLLSGFGGCAHFRMYDCDARIAAGVFAIFNSIAYGIGAWLVYQVYNATPPELQ